MNHDREFRRRRSRTFNAIYLKIEDEKELIEISWKGTCRLEKAIDELKRLIEEGIKVKMR
ncbi:hypothetical protein [Archaeoglobus veneficus]|uniref:hypothetical protein n=1 Tax=Archaeoglobus veneficus TaxID=58290 RepID=UPI000A7D0444|nr:hypothetical protein [Archaeoglobus veneficus]